MKAYQITASLLLATIFISGLCGCSAGATGSVKPAEDGRYETNIEYGSAQIQSRLAITEIRQRKVGDVLQVSVDLKNNWKFTLDFQYKFRFYDKDGFEVDPGGRQWAPIVITGNDIATVQAVAPNPTAESFKIIVRD